MESLAVQEIHAPIPQGFVLFILVGVDENDFGLCCD